MSDCQCLPRCPFFNDKMANKPAMANMYKKQYCQGDATDCARHILFTTLGKEAVPLDMYPNQKSRALEILKAAAVKHA